MFSFVLPTRDRPHRLAETLAALGQLSTPAEIIVIDNAPTSPARAPTTLENGSHVRVLRSPTNLGAAARNLGVRESDPVSRWIVMLDDDSHPIDDGFIQVLREQPADVAAVSADISLPLQQRREDGGLPEVFIGCGVAVRREVFLELGGYDPSFDYYAEEYDLAARIILSGRRVHFDLRFKVAHFKDSTNRDLNRIIARLVRNNGWVTQRYSPEDHRRAELRRTRRRYRAIAAKERVTAGYAAGISELRATNRAQLRRPMPSALFDRFTGLAQAREALAAEQGTLPFRSAALVDEGKNSWAIATALEELGVRLVRTDRADDAEALVIGTLSPGPMLDAAQRRSGDHRRVIVPWLVASAPITSIENGRCGRAYTPAATPASSHD